MPPQIKRLSAALEGLILLASKGGWLGIFGPAEMNPEVVKVLHQSFGKALTDPEVQKQLAQAGLSYRAMGLEQMGVFVKGQRDQFHHLIRDLGIPQID